MNIPKWPSGSAGRVTSGMVRIGKYIPNSQIQCPEIQVRVLWLNYNYKYHSNVIAVQFFSVIILHRIFLTSLHLRFRNLHFISLHFTKNIIAHQFSSLHFTYISSGLYLIHFTSLKKSSEFQPLITTVIVRRMRPTTQLYKHRFEEQHGSKAKLRSSFV